MSSNPYSTEIRRELITIAQHILSNDLGVIAGCREIVGLLRELDCGSDDEDFEAFFVVDAKTNAFSLDNSGAFPDPLALSVQQEAIRQAESRFAREVRRACSRLIECMEKDLRRGDIPSDYRREEAAQSLYIANQAHVTFDKIRDVIAIYMLAFVTPMTIADAVRATEETWTRDGLVWIFIILLCIFVFAIHTRRALKDYREGRMGKWIWTVVVPAAVFIASAILVV